MTAPLAQNPHAILDALVSIIQAAVPELKLVTWQPEHELVTEIPPSQLPAVVIGWNARKSDYTITSTRKDEALVTLYIVAEENTKIADFFDLDYKILGALAGNAQLNLYVLNVNADPPVIWPYAGARRFSTQHLRIVYWSDT